MGPEALEGLEPCGEVVGRDEVREVLAQLVVGLAVEALDRRFLDRPVHPLDLTVGPGMLGLGSPVIDVVDLALTNNPDHSVGADHRDGKELSIMLSTSRPAIGAVHRFSFAGCAKC